MYSLFKPNSAIDETVATTKRRSFFAIGLTFLLVYYISTMISGFILAIPMYYLSFTNDRFIEYIAESDELVNSPDAMTELADGAQKLLLEIFEENASFLNLCSLFATIATIGVVIFYCTKIEKRRLFTLGFSRQGALSEYLIGLGVGLLMIGAVYAIMLITGEARFIEFNLGYFHTWGVDSEELDVGALNYTIGIVELKNGAIVTVMPENIKFLDVS